METERAAVERLSDLDRAKTAFLSTVGHELRTPLTSILGFNEVLSTESVGPLNERQRDLLHRVDRGNRRLLGLIENIAVLSRIDASDEPEQHDWVDLTVLVGSAQRAAERLCWDRSLDVAVPAVATGLFVVHGKPGHIERAVINLVSNAIKFTPDGGSVRVDVRRTPGDRVTITVSDTGMGIPTEEQPHLFDRFFRASNAVAASIQGTGLGLTTVRSIVEEHHGDVSVTSVPGQGTTVSVELPCRPRS